MEWALAVTNCGNLDLVSNPWKNTAFQGQYHPGQVMEAIFGKIKFTRLYFGQEFCERMIPDTGDLAGALRKSRENRMEFTLVTPYTGEKGLDKIERLLAAVQKLNPFGEVVCNDWGVIYLMRKKFPSLVPVMGRLLNKACRDPRMADYPGNTPEVLDLYRYSSSANTYMKSLLQAMHVARVETDNLPQGTARSLPGRDGSVSVYVPYGFISTGRICFTGSWELPQREKFMASGQGCSRLCRRYYMEMRDLSEKVDRETTDGVFQKGNTVFYRHSKNLLTNLLQASHGLGINRTVYQPDPL